MLFRCLPNFFKINFFEKFFKEYHQSVKQFGSRSGLKQTKLPDMLKNEDRFEFHLNTCKQNDFSRRLARVKMKFLSLFRNYQNHIFVAFKAIFTIKMGINFICFFSMKTFYCDVG